MNDSTDNDSTDNDSTDNDRPITFASRLIANIRLKKTPLVVGLDPRTANLPDSLRKVLNADDREATARAFREFCFGVIDVVAPLVPAVKPQAAFFEQIGPHGMQALAEVTRYAHDSGLCVIMDAKRGDIGSTAQAYAAAYLGTDAPWSADALTVNPYMGTDTLEPFVARANEKGCGLFVLVKTSNPGGDSFQGLVTEGRPLFRTVAAHVESLSKASADESGFGQVGAVVGATCPDQLSELRSEMPHTLFLVPGVGAQGATAADVAGAFNDDGLGAVINSSRAIIFAYERPEFDSAENWQQAVELATQQTIDQIADGTPAGRLRSVDAG